MKITINTEAKTISIDGVVNLLELFNNIKNLIPNWEEYSLECLTKIEWKPYRDVNTPISPWVTSPYKPLEVYYGDINRTKELDAGSFRFSCDPYGKDDYTKRPILIKDTFYTTDETI